MDQRHRVLSRQEYLHCVILMNLLRLVDFTNMSVIIRAENADVFNQQPDASTSTYTNTDMFCAGIAFDIKILLRSFCLCLHIGIGICIAASGMSSASTRVRLMNVEVEASKIGQVINSKLGHF